jgi:photosystem II stability/assembly factor-like uncharacterized protein
MNTGANADKVSSGSQWYVAINPDPKRDPAIWPTLYVTQGYGALGLWRSDDGGVNWTNIFSNNAFLPDGTNIAADVGGDVHSVHIPDPAQPNHLFVTLHGYSGTSGNIGVMESVDCGGRWTLRKTTNFRFETHNQIILPFDTKIWTVVAGTLSPTVYMWRTTDGGATWNEVVGGELGRNIGRSFAWAGSTVYAGTDYYGGVFKTTDRGASWKKVLNASRVSWVVATNTMVYAADGYGGSPTKIMRAAQNNDTVWTADASVTMNDNGHTADVTHDGSHYIIIAPQHKAGVWRYVEP